MFLLYKDFKTFRYMHITNTFAYLCVMLLAFCLVTHKGFATPQLVITLMKELSGKDTIHPEAIKQNEQRITKFLTGLKVDYEVPNQSNSKRTYRINGLGPNAREIEFEYDESVGTVEEFFKQKKNYKLQWPTLPCLWVGSQTKEQKTYLPAEVRKPSYIC